MISRLHYITQDLPNFSHAQLVEFACKGGADWVQLRVKNKPYEEWLKIAQETKLICLKYGAKFIINDSAQIAKEVEADGVHLGKNDMNPKEARKMLGNNFIIGGSANSREDVRKQMADGCDYIGIGPFRHTTTKEKLSPILGIDGIRNIIRAMSPSPRQPSSAKVGGTTRWVDFPMIAIGGIKLEDIEPLMQTGVHGVAVSSGINSLENKTETTRRFLTLLGMTTSVMPL
ncbi:MAG: thiamine phosphate synthase [Bacteroidetes bacterium]|nr:MAG: thiamine phosphate synthase [Bacteroidota bacterium]